MSFPTPHDDLNLLLHDLTVGLQHTLGDTLVGVYLQGSFALGGHDDHSDVDFLAVLHRPMSAHQVAQVRALHERLHDAPSRWATRLEGSYFPWATLCAAPQPGALLWYKDNGSRVLQRSDHCNTWVVRATLRQAGLRLAGPLAAQLCAPVLVGALRREIAATMRDWGQQILAAPERYHNAFYQRFIAVSYARMLHDLRRGTPGTKPEAVAWAAATLAPRWAALVTHAHHTRTDPAVASRTAPDAAAFAETLAFVPSAIALAPRLVPNLDAPPTT